MRMQAFNQWLLSDAPALALRHAAKPSVKNIGVIVASPLSDLDELVLRCRDEKAKKYIKEAVSCYKVGAFRSSIVSAWVAVSFDIIDKLKELSLAGFHP
jgi:hypothetical protein